MPPGLSLTRDSPLDATDGDMSLQPELASRDDDGRAADFHTVDPVALAERGRVERRRPADLRALGDRDLVAESRSPVACEVDCERARRRPGRRIFRDAAPRSERARLP